MSSVTLLICHTQLKVKMTGVPVLPMEVVLGLTHRIMPDDLLHLGVCPARRVQVLARDGITGLALACVCPTNKIECMCLLLAAKV